ncbi:PAM68-like protein [Dioscorea alata]|uniref:PAM68-like protein n=1 Tax=Dioscorea alata TaxID=55571 RepID=A0ACB7WP49_DIOAL|nr:PAM68-like protein [Dioscorea alata]
MEARIQALHHQMIIKVPSTLHPNKPWMITPPVKTKKKNIHINKAQGKGFGSTTNITQNNTTTSQEKEKQYQKQKDDDEIPEEVFNRILKRIFFFVGVPMASSVALLYLMEFLNENKLWAVPLWLPFLTVLLGFGTSAMGIAYGSLSTSWDPDREGSLLGWQEAQKNWPELWKDDDERQRR